MSITEVQNIIIQHLMEFNPDYIGVFGSYSRDENIPSSDFDVLVKFKNVPSLLQLIRIENELSEITGIKIDLITEGAIKNSIIKTSIQKDLKVIYQA